MSPERRRKCVDHIRAIFKVSERRACRVLGQSRRTQRYIPKPDPVSDNLTAEIRMLALRHPRYGYKRITALLKAYLLAGQPQARPAHLARAGIEGPDPKGQEVAPLAGERTLHASYRRAPQPRLGLRLCLTSAPRTAGPCGSSPWSMSTPAWPLLPGPPDRSLPGT